MLSMRRKQSVEKCLMECMNVENSYISSTTLENPWHTSKLAKIPLNLIDFQFVRMAYLLLYGKVSNIPYTKRWSYCMATLKELRLKARLSAEELGRKANITGKTVKRAENGLPVQELKAVAIVEALGQALGQELKPEDIENLVI